MTLLYCTKSCSYKFPNIYRKEPVLRSLFNKAECPSDLQLFKKETSTQVLSVDMTKFLRLPILKNICERLLLDCFNGLFHSMLAAYAILVPTLYGNRETRLRFLRLFTLILPSTNLVDCADDCYTSLY